MLAADRLAWVRPRVEFAAPAAFAIVAVVLLSRDEGGYFPTSWGPATIAFAAVALTFAFASGRVDAGRLDVFFVGSLLLLATWTGISFLWSSDPALSVLALERSVVLLTGCAAFLVLARKGSSAQLAVALEAAIAGICIYALSTRLFPVAAHFHPGDPISGYRLSVPIGYWNALGAVAAMGAVLALGLATDRALPTPARALAVVSLTALPLTLFFTFSRGAWLALAAGLIVAVLVSTHRLRLLAEGAVLSLPAVLAIVAAWHSTGLTDKDATLALAAHDGRRLAAILVVLGAASLLLLAGAIVLERHVQPSPRSRLIAGAALAAAALAALLAGLAHFGLAPATRAYDSFVTAAPPREHAELTTRLFDANGNGRARLWSVALDGDRGHWLGGTGAGTFVRTWEASPRADQVVRDAHGLFVQTLSELGVAGLGLLLVVLVLPLAAGLRRRRVPGVPAVLAAYAAFLVHNGVDWDWQLAAVALTGLLLGCVLLVADRRGPERQLPPSARLGVGAAAVLLGAAATAALVGNGALAAAQAANTDGRYAQARSDAATAERWMPWSPEPLKALGTARFRTGDTAGARASFRRAISVDARDWQAWLDLAATVEGRSRTRAVARARSLYPTSPEVAEFLASLHR